MTFNIESYSAVYGYAPQILERALIAEATATIEHHEGCPPQGWLGQWISETDVTPDPLKEAGYSYVMDWPLDDQPVWLATRAGRLLAMPYPVEINDAPALLTRHHTAADFTGMMVDQFEEMLRQSEQQALVCRISLHAPVLGATVPAGPTASRARAYSHQS